MSENNREIISIQPSYYPNDPSLFQLGCDLGDTAKRTPRNHSFRYNLNPDPVNTAVSAPGYVLKHLVPQREEGALDMWTGVLIEHNPECIGDPKILGAVAVRPKTEIVCIEAGTQTRARKSKTSRMTKMEVTCVDAWVTDVTSNEHGVALSSLLRRGAEAGERLFQGPVVTIESEPRSMISRRPQEHPTLDIVQEVFSHELFYGFIVRPDPKNTRLLRDGTRQSVGYVLGRDNVESELT